jgi:transposase InsO family protein
MESSWGTLKNELAHDRRYETREQAQCEITEYIDIFYNRQRRHSAGESFARGVCPTVGSSTADGMNLQRMASPVDDRATLRNKRGRRL